MGPIAPLCTITSKSSIADMEISADTSLPVSTFFDGTSSTCKVDGCKIEDKTSGSWADYVIRAEFTDGASSTVNGQVSLIFATYVQPDPKLLRLSCGAHVSPPIKVSKGAQLVETGKRCASGKMIGSGIILS